MGYKVIEEKFGNSNIFKLINTNTKEYVSILPEYGGMLNSLVLLFKDELVPILDDYKTNSELEETLDSSFKGSNLFPFPNRIDSGKFSFEGKKYQLHVNFPHEDNAIHGLVYKEKFEVIENLNTGDEARLFLKYSPPINIPGFPFKYDLTIRYTFSSDTGLVVTTKVTNNDRQNIPIGQGWHPYFKLKSKVNDLSIMFPGDKSFEVNDKMIPTGVSNPYSKYNVPEIIGENSFDTCFSIASDKKKAETIINDPVLSNSLCIWQETGKDKFNYLQIYTPEHRNTIALEPMTCMPDALNNKNGLIVLQPGQSTEFSWGIRKV